MMVFVVTNICNLKCKLCSVGVPYYKSHHHAPLEEIEREAEEVFKIYNHIGHIDIIGGEPLLHPELAQIIAIFEKYSSCFDTLRVITNSTLMLKPDVISAMKAHGDKFQFLIDNYGPLSNQVDILIKQCDENQIPYKMNTYFGNHQHCDGWIDFGNFESKNYKENEIQEMYDKCHLAHDICIHVQSGQLHHCDGSLLFTFVYGGKMPESEYIDLFDTRISIEEKRIIANNFGKKPIEACKYCNGFDVEFSERFPAAEQLR